MENPIKMDDLGVPPILGNPKIIEKGKPVVKEGAIWGMALSEVFSDTPNSVWLVLVDGLIKWLILLKWIDPLIHWLTIILPKSPE